MNNPVDNNNNNMNSKQDLLQDHPLDREVSGLQGYTVSKMDSKLPADNAKPQLNHN